MFGVETGACGLTAGPRFGELAVMDGNRRDKLEAAGAHIRRARAAREDHGNREPEAVRELRKLAATGTRALDPRRRA